MRIRTIKPEFWQSEDLADVSDKAKLLAIGLLNMADDEGYLKSHPAIIRSQLFPFTDGSLDIHGLISELSNARYLECLMGDDGKDYILVTNFTKHQKVNRPTPSKIKAGVKLTDNSLINHTPVTVGKEGKGRERKGTGKGAKELSTKVDVSNLVFEYWKLVMNKSSQSVFNDKRKKAVKARLIEGYTLDQIKQAIDGCANTPHNMGKNQNNKLYDDLELICRDGSNLERFAQNINTVVHTQQFSDVTMQNIENFRSVELK